MNATVIAVDTNAVMTTAKGNFNVTKLTVTTDKGETKDINIFKNAAYIQTVNGLVKGDNIDIKYVKNGKYWNVDGVTKIANDTPPTSDGGPAPSNNKDVEIRRAVALKAAVELVCSMDNIGSLDEATAASIRAAQVLEHYLAGSPTLDTDEDVPF